jgi:hypothetical protein
LSTTITPGRRSQLGTASIEPDGRQLGPVARGRLLAESLKMF